MNLLMPLRELKFIDRDINLFILCASFSCACWRTGCKDHREGEEEDAGLGLGKKICA